MAAGSWCPSDGTTPRRAWRMKSSWTWPRRRWRCWAITTSPNHRAPGARLGDKDPVPPSGRQRGASIDPGWLFAIAGLAILACTVLLPALDDLGEARWQRDRALAIEKHRLVRLARYKQYLDALDSKDPALILS